MLRAMLDSSTPAATEPHSPPTPQRRPPGKPWAGGQSGNPSGRRAKPVDPGELARRHARAAVRTLVAALRSPDTAAAVHAAEVLLCQGFGLPNQHLALGLPRLSLFLHAPPDDAETARTNGEARAWNA